MKQLKTQTIRWSWSNFNSNFGKDLKEFIEWLIWNKALNIEKVYLLNDNTLLIFENTLFIMSYKLTTSEASDLINYVINNNRKKD